MGRRIADLDHRRMRGLLGAHDHRGSRHAFATVEPDLDLIAALLLGNDRSYAFLEEIDAADRLIRVEERVFVLELHALEVRLQQREIGLVKRAKQQVGNRCLARGHASASKLGREHRGGLSVACALWKWQAMIQCTPIGTR